MASGRIVALVSSRRWDFRILVSARMVEPVQLGSNRKDARSGLDTHIVYLHIGTKLK
jgi:hypothetical protein